ncbi:hypothetical protein TTHERM_01040860 (macronuclear) [Tetrahymena thermophila SB210]|uniref:Zinc carboxypeptidase family protein n=1 Tax=Tetrahymena thermophila (strain SB210) TaxID=312017 RepID=Q24DA0_TETTS|nr:hypothetical protein TTHERM_01040860 [Tetrahymena thermophila SB210]EAS05745.1 hypothetical protein TTHERM_01040860 [Tetrahymena thermophila SB210]|eukprot:XP_001025990.1 hypothetical protein TTHERM_01040860 [Tetrahymena thermophila SB210]
MENILNNSQNFKQILCQKHNLTCLCLQTDSDDSDDIYACSNCIRSNNNFKQCLLLQDIKDKLDNTVLTNWPLLDEYDLMIQIQSFSKYQGNQNLIQKDIVKFFEDFQNELEHTLQKQKKNMLIYADGISEKTNQLFDYYREIAQFDALKNIIDSDTQKQQQAEQILQIFKTNKQNQENYKNKIQQQLSQLNQYQTINLNVLKSFKDSILSQIELVDGKYLSNLQLFSQKNNILIEEFKKQQQNQNILLKENENLYTLLNLIGNKTNNCNENYLQSVKSELLKIQDLINILNIDKDVFQQGKKQIQIGLEKLSQDQIEYIETLVNKIVDLNEQYQQLKEEDNNMIISSKLQPSSYLIYNQIFKLDKKLTKQKLESITKLLRRFPIFEIEQLVKPYPCKLEVEISNQNNYNTNGKQSYDNEGNQKFEIVKEGFFIFYMKIKQDCLYRIVINLELKYPNRYLFIGLVGKSHKDQKYIYENSFINSFTTESSYSDRGVSKVIKGKCLRDVKYPEEYNQIEIRFCVKNKMFQVSDYPKRENINEINDDKLNLIDLNQEYYLGFELVYDKDSLTILECEELQYQN